MSEFYWNKSKIKPQEARIQGAKRTLADQAKALYEIEENLSFEQLGSGSTHIKQTLQQLGSDVAGMEKEAGNMADGLHKIGELYETTESSIIDASGKKSMLDFLNRPFSVYSGSVTGKFVSASYDALTGQINAKADINIEKENDVYTEVSAFANAGLEGHVAHGKVTGKYGIVTGSVESTAIKGSVEAEAKGILIQDGKIDPAVSLKVGAEAVGLEASAEAKVGTDEYNMHGNAEGAIGDARAEAEFTIGKVTDPETGQTSRGVKAELGAEATLFKGKVSGGVTICGVKIDVGVTGKAFSAGATASFDSTSSSVHGKLGISALVGGDLELSIDWSDLKFPWD